MEHRCGQLYCIKYVLDGCSLAIVRVCANGHSSVWESSEVVLNQKNKKVYNNNLCFTAAVVLSGNNFNKIKQFCNIIGIKTISKSTFHSYQPLYICPTVAQFYEKQQVSLDISFICAKRIMCQEKILSTLKGKEVILSGDGRCDSPGKTAKYCTYSMMENEDNLILHAVNFDKRQAQLRSPKMERMALVNCLQYH